MSSVVVGCDTNNSNDSKFQNAVAKILTKQGHKVQKLSIGPTPFGSIGYEKKVKGKIGIYIMAASLTSVADLSSSGWQFKYTYFIIRGDIEGGRIKSVKDFNSKAIHKDPEGDCKAAVCNRWNGKTYPEINKQIKDKGMIIFGGKTGKEIANNIVKAMGGDVDSSEDSNSTNTGTSIKEALKKAVSGWDGEVQINLRDDTVYVNKIPDPTTATFSINEFEDVQYDSVTVTDANPSTINQLTLQYKDYELTLQDAALIKRFGLNKQVLPADKTIKSLKEAKSFLNREWSKIRRDDGRSVELKVNGHYKWKTGIWVRVYLPSFFIDDYMYITKTSNDEDGTGNWSTNLTLVDYPPSFGKFVEEETDKKNEEEASEESEDSDEIAEVE